MSECGKDTGYERDYRRICRSGCVCTCRRDDSENIWRGTADGEFMKEVVEEYGGVILEILMGGLMLTLLVSGMGTDGGFRELLILFFRGIGTEVF